MHFELKLKKAFRKNGGGVGVGVDLTHLFIPTLPQSNSSSRDINEIEPLKLPNSNLGQGDIKTHSKDAAAIR